MVVKCLVPTTNVPSHIATCMYIHAGIVLVTDAIAAMGLGSGLHQLGTMTVEVKDKVARLPVKQTLAGRYVRS